MNEEELGPWIVIDVQTGSVLARKLYTEEQALAYAARLNSAVNASLPSGPYIVLHEEQSE